ncbi:MAG: MFS transporter, partial [Pseudomonadales bacterium]|nr:MFS transporter [Pseudomonadales bacterium]
MFANNKSAGERSYIPFAFWLGATAVVFGVIAHFPMYIESAAMNYRMVGMKMSPLMYAGMFAIIAGIISVAYALTAPGLRNVRSAAHTLDDVHIRALDDAKFTAAHWKLFAVLVVALIVDVMKPATLGFVLPGTAAEYGLSKSAAALMPVAGILGTTVGSFIWGWAGDTIGRRAAILLAAIVFIGTSICGAMPSYSWNVLMCFLMGLGAGGMLPITFALMAEIAPVRHRGFIVVLLGGLGTIGGYLAASGLATLLEPSFGWRIMWLVGLPTGAVLILLNRFIPESPRFLMTQARDEEAAQVLQKFGVVVDIQRDPSNQPVRKVSGNMLPHAREMFLGAVAPLTYALSLYGLAWGLVNFGFLLWLPMHLREVGLSVGASDQLLAQSALIAFPSTLLAAWAYHYWSAQGSMVVCAALTAVTLAGFALLGVDLAKHSPIILAALIVVLLATSSSVIAMLSPYTAEVFPVKLRASGTGWTAGCSKAAGVATLSAAVFGFTPGVSMGALIAAAPMLGAALVMAIAGVETRGASLETIQRKI